MQYTKEAIYTLLSDNDMAVVKGLEALYLRQTADERSSETTKYSNGIGFNGTDANILSSFARQIAKWRAEKAETGSNRYPFPLSPKQLGLARYKIRKYAGQLADVANAKLVANDPAAQAALALEQDAAREARDAAREAQKAVDKAAREAARDVEFAGYHARVDARQAAIEAELDAEEAEEVALRAQHAAGWEIRAKLAAAEEAENRAKHAAEDAAAAAAELAAERAAIQAAEIELATQAEFDEFAEKGNIIRQHASKRGLKTHEVRLSPVNPAQLKGVGVVEADDDDDYLSL